MPSEVIPVGHSDRSCWTLWRLGGWAVVIARVFYPLLQAGLEGGLRVQRGWCRESGWIAIDTVGSRTYVTTMFHLCLLSTSVTSCNLSPLVHYVLLHNPAVVLPGTYRVEKHVWVCISALVTAQRRKHLLMIFGLASSQHCASRVPVYTAG